MNESKTFSSEVRIEIRSGSEAQSMVDPFYAKHGSRGFARPDDIFFLAINRDGLAGCVRYCLEEKTPLLRTMMIDERFRRNGIGLRLLKEFATYLDQNNIRNVFCLPYAHLNEFYGAIGFQRVHTEHTPHFLLERMAAYQEGGSENICMRRP